MLFHHTLPTQFFLIIYLFWFSMRQKLWVVPGTFFGIISVKDSGKLRRYQKESYHWTTGWSEKSCCHFNSKVEMLRTGILLPIPILITNECRSLIPIIWTGSNHSIYSRALYILYLYSCMSAISVLPGFHWLDLAPNAWLHSTFSNNCDVHC